MTKLYGFELLREQDVPEIALRAELYRHTRTGAELLALVNDDSNKTFGAAFRVVPKDDTGVAHILEHCVLLGGSRKYPVKDLFVELIKGSPATFVNGLTTPDNIIYPYASQNLQDFYNLMDVYMDIVLHPLLGTRTFEQEGWHYHLESLDDPLAYRGVVFNEVKGERGSPDDVLHTEGLHALFPDTVYGRSYGGDPRHIPDLTYEQLQTFHATYCHPSNARFFLYGDFPREECLRRMDDYLKDFDRTPASSGEASQKRFDEPRSFAFPYATESSSPDHDEWVTVNWVLAENDDPARTLALEVLREALVGSPGAPLRKALLDSGLGEDLAGLSEWLQVSTSSAWAKLRQLVFSVGLKRVAPDDVARVESLIVSTLERLAGEGLAPEILEAAFNTVEFRLRENHALMGQRGLALMVRALATWTHGNDPLALLAFAAPLALVKEQWSATPRFFEGLIRDYLLENPHRAILHLFPDPDFIRREDNDERERLAQARVAMSEADVLDTLENTRVLKKMQETPNSPKALATMPVLERSNLERTNKHIPLEILEEARTRVLYHSLPTTGITYLDLGFNLRALSQEDLPYAALFGRILLEMGTRTQDYVQLTQRVGRFTGGIQPQVLASEALGEAPGPVWLFLRAKATTNRAGDLLAILRDVLVTVNLDDRERFQRILLEETTRREANLSQRAARQVNRRLRAHFSEASWASDQLEGVGGLFFLRRLAREVESDWPAVLTRLEAVHSALVNQNTMLANVTMDLPAWPRFRSTLASFLADLPVAPITRMRWTRPSLETHEGFTIPSQVNYVGKGADLYAGGYILDGSALVINHYLSSAWLWDKLRTQGGAYGSFSAFDYLSGVLTYFSSQDPNLSPTLDIYDGTSDFLRQTEIDDKELTRNIIGAITELDPYRLVDEQGFTSMTRYLSGDDDESRQRIRDELLSTTPAHFRAFADALDTVRREGHVVVMASEENLRAADKQRGDGWLAISRLL